MSLVSTLGKLALGAIAARGVGKMLGGGAGGGNIAGVLGGLLGGGGTGGSALSGLLGGGKQGGGLGGLLGGGGGQESGGLGGLLSSLGGGGQQSGGGLGGLLNSALQGNAAPEVQASQEDERQAEIMLKAMISATKADGKIDEEEQRKLTEHLGDVSAEELEFVRNEMNAPQDLEGLVASVPAGMEQQVYLMSLLAIDLDSKPEAQYLDQLAKGLNINQQQCNAIHEKLGVPQLYA